MVAKRQWARAMGYIAIAVGILALAGSALAWLGRWRRWTRTFITAHLPVPLTILPAFGMQLVSFGLHEEHPFSGSRILIGLALISGLVAPILAVWNPAWFGPAWFRELKASGRPIDPDLSDPLTAVTYAMAKTGINPREDLPPSLREPQPLRRWRVSLVAEKAGAGLSDLAWILPKGKPKVGGHLELHEAGLAFYMNSLEARMHKELTTIALDKADVEAIEVLPFRMGSLPAIEIKTSTGELHRFEAFFPSRIAREIVRTLVK